MIKEIISFLSGSFGIIGLCGCATVKSLDSDLPLNRRVFVYSGTRLDWSSLAHDKATLSKIRVDPPRCPLADLPFSFVLDSFLLPLTVSAELFH